MQYLTQHPDTHEEGNNVLKDCRWSIAAGKRPVPFRTRKLSLHTLMVLQPGGCGRVSHRRHQTTKTQQNTTKKRTVYHRPLLFAFYQPSRPVEGLICKAKSTAEGYGGESLGGLTSCHRPQRGKGAPRCLCIRGLLNYFYYHRIAYPVAANGFNQGHREAGSTRLGVPGLCY